MIAQFKFKAVFFLIFAVILSLPLHAEKKVLNSVPTDTSIDVTQGVASTENDLITNNSSGDLNPFKSVEFLLSLAVLIFGMIVVLLEVFLAHIGKIDSDHIFKCIILTLVITGSIVLITAGYSNNQITGVVGILGSIAGYMLGKSIPEKGKTETPAPIPNDNLNVKANEQA